MYLKDSIPGLSGTGTAEFFHDRWLKTVASFSDASGFYIDQHIVPWNRYER